MTEDQLEREPLVWLQDVGYTHRYAVDGQAHLAQVQIPA